MEYIKNIYMYISYNIWNIIYVYGKYTKQYKITKYNTN